MLAGCRQILGFDEPTLGSTSDGAVTDVPGDTPTCTDMSTTCSGDALVVCTAPGTSAIVTPCVWGCLDSGASITPHCAQLVPSGGGVPPQDLLPNSLLMDTGLSSPTIDVDTGAISGNIRAAGSGVQNGIGYAISPSGVAVFVFASLSMSGTIKVSGAHPLALVANGAISVSGEIDGSGTCSANVAGPGGFTGGTAGMAGGGSSAGTGGGDNTKGGGGGGYGGGGGAGGGGDLGGGVNGDAMISTLLGGSGGGGGGANSSGGLGGGGGGAIQLTSNLYVHIEGGINVGGCGGKGPGSAGGGGGGGGAGGAILIEAPTIEVTGILAANGGGGGAGDSNGGAGTDGADTRVPAQGGVALIGTGVGGVGAAGATTTGSPGGNGNHGGGGGGGMGRIRLNTKAGSAQVNGSTMSPALSDGTLATQGVATVQ